MDIFRAIEGPVSLRRFTRDVTERSCPAIRLSKPGRRRGAGSPIPEENHGLVWGGVGARRGARKDSGDTGFAGARPETNLPGGGGRRRGGGRPGDAHTTLCVAVDRWAGGGEEGAVGDLGKASFPLAAILFCLSHAGLSAGPAQMLVMVVEARAARGVAFMPRNCTRLRELGVERCYCSSPKGSGEFMSNGFRTGASSMPRLLRPVGGSGKGRAVPLRSSVDADWPSFSGVMVSELGVAHVP